MAIVYAVKTGNWSDTTVWNTGALPTSADDVYPNTFTVTINQNITVASLQNLATTGVSAGGQFRPLGNYTIVASNIVSGSANLIGVFNQSGALTITCNTMTSGSGTLMLVQDCSLNITINGNLSAVGSGQVLLFSIGSNTGTINGNLIAGGNSCINFNNMTTYTFAINGYAQSSTSSVAINSPVNSANAIISVQKAITIDNGLPSISNNFRLPTVTVKEIEQGVFGQVPIQGYVRLSTASGAFYKGVTTGSSTRTLTDVGDIAGQVPAQSDVRFGVTYQSGSKTGTAYIPAASSVGFGVPVDNTTGTAALTPASVWDAATSSLTTSGSIGERLKNASTVDTTGDQLAALL
jgi:hypothetical protein